jgi:hypothetical protein
MRVIGNLQIEKDSNLNYPFGASIKNETETQNGTPVIEEIYGDILMNIYKILEVTGNTPTDAKDDNSTQYQLLEALKMLPNKLNDIEQVLTLNGTIWEVPLNLSILPNKYTFFARASEDYISGITYDFKGISALTLDFFSEGFKASDELLVVIDTNGVRAYSLSILGDNPSDIFTPFGSPLAYNDSNVLYYQEDGYLITDQPTSVNLEGIIRVDASDGTLIVTDINISQGHVLCSVIKPTDSNYYEIFTFPLGNYATSTKLTKIGVTQTRGDYLPNIYFNQLGVVYITNEAGNTVDNKVLSLFNIDFNLNTITYSSTYTLSGFVKTSNAFIRNNDIYTLIGGEYSRTNLSTGINTSLASFNSIIGQVFSFNSSVYFGSGEVAKKWF